MIKKAVLTALTIFVVLSFTTISKAEETVLDVEGWSLILGSCEKVVFNDDFRSGLERCYYLDPTHRYGVGAAMWAFYKDGTKYLHWKGWMLHTDKTQTAHLLDDGKWYVTKPGKMPYEMGYLSAMRTFFEKAKNVVDGKLTLEKTIGYVVNEIGERIMDKTVTVYFNKNSANNLNPTK